MFLYYFNPNNYGQEYFIMAENKTEACNYLLSFLRNALINTDSDGSFEKENLELWEKINPLDSTTFPMEYTLEEYEKGSVILSEIC